MKKFKYLLLLLLLPLNVFATYDSDKYFNLLYPTNIASDVSSSSSVYFGASTTLYDVLNDLKNVDTSGRKLFISLNTSGGSVNKIILSALEIGSMPYINVYGTDNSGTLAFKHYFINDLSTLSYTFSSCNSGGSILESEAYNTFKTCLSSGICSNTLPTESTYTCNVISSTSKTILNTSFNVSNYDNSSSNFNITTRIVPYYSDLTLIYKEKSSYINRKLHIEDTLDIGTEQIYPTYYDFTYVEPEPEPEPDIDTNVGVWKNYVLWFVDNNSIYGLLVNLYILMFVSIIGTSFIVFIKLIRKNRW